MIRFVPGRSYASDVKIRGVELSVVWNADEDKNITIERCESDKDIYELLRCVIQDEIIEYIADEEDEA